MFPDLLNGDENGTIDSTIANDFTALIDGTECVAYQLYILTLLDVPVYDSTKIILGTSIFNNEILTVNVPNTSGMTNGNEYKWKIDLYYDGSNFITSEEKAFQAFSVPTISFNPSLPALITEQSYEFVGNYAQAEGIDVKYFEIILYDSDIPSPSILDTSGVIYSSNIRHTFSGFIDGNFYHARILGKDQNDIDFDTGISAFEVDYASPNISIIPTAISNSDSSITVDWGIIIPNSGIITGASSYENDIMVAGDTVLKLFSGSYVNFTQTIPTIFSLQFDFVALSTGFTGKILELSYSENSNTLEISYVNGAFVLVVNGYSVYHSHILSLNPYVLHVGSDGDTVDLFFKEKV